MPLTKQEKIPNLPLSGWELSVYVRSMFKKVLEQRGVLDSSEIELVLNPLTAAMQNDCFFSGSFMYPKVSFEIAAQFHRIGDRFAYSVQPLFKTANPLQPTHTPFIRRLPGTPPPPVVFTPEDEHVVDCFTALSAVDNPNLVRVHNGMPVSVTASVPPAVGELFGKIERHEVRYDPTDYPPLPDPAVTDQTEAFARQWGISTGKWTGVKPVVAEDPEESYSDPVEYEESVEPSEAPLKGMGSEPATTIPEDIPAPPASAPPPPPAPGICGKPRDRRGWRK
jgi:hypothetical protein